MTEKRVKYFDMKSIVPGTTILVIGKRASGKTSLIFDAMEHMSRWFPDEEGNTGFDAGRAITPTMSSMEKFSACIPSCFIERPSVEGLDFFVQNVQKVYLDDKVAGRKLRNTFLICDDTAFNEKFMRCETLSECFLNGRHSNITIIIVLQYLMKAAPDIRTNADFVFVFWDVNLKNQQNIHKFWFGSMDKKDFLEVFSDCTQDYGCLVIDLRKGALSRNWREFVYWYKAKLPEEHPPFQLCKPDMYRLDEYCRTDANLTCIDDNQQGVLRLGADGNVYEKNKNGTTN